MNNAETNILSWAQLGENITTPKWDDLPNIPLYMDQVIFYLKDSLGFFERDENSQLLTSSMINNYVKNDVVPHPEKKKYSKEHLAALMAVCMLKQVLSMQDIKTLLGGSVDCEMYELFRETHNNAVREACEELTACCNNGDDLKTAAMRLAVEANAKRAAAERILCELAKDNDESSPKKK